MLAYVKPSLNPQSYVAGGGGVFTSSGGARGNLNRIMHPALYAELHIDYFNASDFFYY